MLLQLELRESLPAVTAAAFVGFEEEVLAEELPGMH